ncbi:MAG: AAA family ATPase [Spirochaetes bacterium]|nr:AAA family ATPase [Spirochaetota bacterium]
MDGLPYLKEISIKTSEQRLDSKYPFNIPAIKVLDSIQFKTGVTYFIGENGSGKSTLLESIAIALGFNSEGGSKNFNFSTRKSHSNLHDHLNIKKSYLRPKDGFFLRAESFYNVATNIEDMDSVPCSAPLVIDAFGGKYLHCQSHGESFLSLLLNRFRGNGLYILDEPEAALSPSHQMTALSRIHQLVNLSSQFIIATHSPIIMAYPNSIIYQLDENGFTQVNYEDTMHYQVTKSFLNRTELMLKELFD